MSDAGGVVPVAGTVGAPRRARTGAARGRRVALAVGAVLLVVLLAWAVWLGVDALRARAELRAAAGLVGTLQEQVLAGDGEAAATLTELQGHALAADDAAHGPQWTAARPLPWVGAHVRALQTVTGAVDDLATDALPSLADAARVVDPARLTPVDGRIDLAPLQQAAPVVVAADGTVQDALARVAAIDTAGLLPPVGGAVDQLRDRLAQVASTTATAARAVTMLPAMLGADGPRQYLLLVQNNAEPRALGGIPGAVILLRADAGRVELLEQRNAGGVLAALPEPALPLADAERALFGDQVGTYMADVTFTPDFPRAAALAAAIWQQRLGGPVDGVVSLDTHALAAVLGATGPVPLPPGAVADAVGGGLSADNAVEVLNNTVYRLVEDPDVQDAFYAQTGAAVFAALLGGRGTPVETVAAFADAARDGLLTVWSARPDEQRRLVGTVLGGELRGDSDGAPVLGFYVNDGTGSKIGYYLRTEVALTPGACAADGSRLVDAVVRLTSTAPPEVVDMPEYIAGGRVLEPGRMRVTLLAYAPTGGVVESAVSADGRRGGASQVHDGLFVLARTLELAPGGSTEIRYEVRTGPGLTAPPLVRTTPVVDRETVRSGDWRCG